MFRVVNDAAKVMCRGERRETFAAKLWAALAGFCFGSCGQGFSLWLPSVLWDVCDPTRSPVSQCMPPFTAESFQDDHKTPLDLMIFHRTSLSLWGRAMVSTVAFLSHSVSQGKLWWGLCQPTVASLPLDCCLDSALMAAGGGQVPCLLPKGWHT